MSFNTWSRNINGIKKESLLDHVYVNSIPAIANVNYVTPTFGVQVLVMVKLDLKVDKVVKTQQRRNWRGYSATNFNNLISNTP